MLNPPVNVKIQGLFNAFGCFSSTFKANLIFKDFSRVLYIQVLFKPVQTLYAITVRQNLSAAAVVHRLFNG